MSNPLYRRWWGDFLLWNASCRGGLDSLGVFSYSGFAIFRVGLALIALPDSFGGILVVPPSCWLGFLPFWLTVGWRALLDLLPPLKGVHGVCCRLSCVCCSLLFVLLALFVLL